MEEELWSSKFIFKMIKAKTKIWIRLRMYELRGWIVYHLIKLWEFLKKRRSIRVFPRLRVWIMKITAILGAIWIISVPVVFSNIDSQEVVNDTWKEFKSAVYEYFSVSLVVEASPNVGDVVSPSPSFEDETATQDIVDGDVEVSQEDETPLSVEKIVDTIHQLESSGGVKNYSKCDSKGLYNEYGYGIPGNGKYTCFEKGEDRKAVIAWFEKELKDKSIESAICGYNLGYRSEHFQDCLNESSEYPYLKNFKKLNS